MLALSETRLAGYITGRPTEEEEIEEYPDDRVYVKGKRHVGDKQTLPSLCKASVQRKREGRLDADRRQQRELV